MRAQVSVHDSPQSRLLQARGRKFAVAFRQACGTPAPGSGVEVGAHNEDMVSHGDVREWNEDEGFGVIDSPDTPGGCWAHFSSIVMDGYRSLAAGDPVAFTCEAGLQDGYDYRAILVWPPGVEPGTPPSREAISEEPGLPTKAL